jgi:hypothetical protein
MKLILIILLNILIVGLFLFSKLTPYKDKLTGNYLKVFLIFESIFNPLLNFLKRFIKPTQVGSGIAVDMSQIILLIIFLLINAKI